MGYGLLVRCPAPSPECEIREHGGLCFSRRMFWTDACVKRPTSPPPTTKFIVQALTPLPWRWEMGPLVTGLDEVMRVGYPWWD